MLQCEKSITHSVLFCLGDGMGTLKWQEIMHLTQQITTLKENVVLLVTHMVMDILTTRSKLLLWLVSQLLLTVSQTEYLQKTWLLVHYKYTTKGVLVQKCLSYLSDRKLCNRILPEEKHFKSRFVSFCCGHSILL